MTTLTEIEEAAVKLPAEEQQRLLRFLLRIVPVSDGALPEPRVFSAMEIQQWQFSESHGDVVYQPAELECFEPTVTAMWSNQRERSSLASVRVRVSPCLSLQCVPSVLVKNIITRRKETRPDEGIKRAREKHC